MRKIFLVLICLLFLPIASYAASIGGADTQGKGKLAFALDSDYTFDREFQRLQVTQFISGLGWTANVKAATKSTIGAMYRETIKISYGILDNLDIYAKVGTAKIDDYEMKVDGTFTLSTPFGDTTVPIRGVANTRSHIALAYGGGIKGKINLLRDWFIGCDTEYLRHRTRTKISSWQNVEGIDYDRSTDKGYITFEEWQGAAYLAKKIGNFTPYAGAKYSYARVKYETDSTGGGNEKTGNKVGAFCGLDYNISKHLSLNLEGRFIDETSVSGAVAYKF